MDSLGMSVVEKKEFLEMNRRQRRAHNARFKRRLTKPGRPENNRQAAAAVRGYERLQRWFGIEILG